MTWPGLDEIIVGVDIPTGYELDLLSESEIEPLVAKIAKWYPALGVGSESCHLEPNFYRTEVVLKGTRENRDVFVAVVKHAGEIVALFSVGANWRSNSLAGKLTVIAPEHQNSALGYLCIALFEKTGRLMNAGMIWVTGTLQHSYSQKIMEKRGFELCGIIPAYDLDVIDGKPKYVTEALYVKVLVDSDQLQEIKRENLTDKTQALLSFLKK